MKNCFFTALLAFFFSCSSSGGAVDGDIGGEFNPDAAEIEVSESSEAEIYTGDAAELEEDAPLTCESILAAKQCLEDKKCAAGMKCAGVVDCPEENCWGICDRIPGVCHFVSDGKICEEDADCGQKMACVFSTACVTDEFCGKGAEIGICLPKPEDQICYENDDCWGGLVCGGEYLCRADRFCLGKNHPGKCLPAHGAGKCWDDGDCGQGSYCKGAVICMSGDCEDNDTPGVCEPVGDNPVFCAVKAECGEFMECAGAYKCVNAGGCAIKDAKGFCINPPGLNGCWGDSDCAADELCSGSIICPPGYPCSKDYLPGTCVKFSKPAVTVKTSKTKYAEKEEIRVSILNASGHLVFMPGCLFFTLEEWIGSEFIDTGPVSQCDGEYFIRLIPDGWSAAAVLNIAKKGKFRINFLGAVGCTQGVKDSNPNCRGGFEVKSSEFTVGI
ncbi:MAG: hypothetical protein FJ088_09215 [Deltaproteobacteria bacterium]|nr:hypothetical protein [Deltaproteobacteria bacterium]